MSSDYTAVTLIGLKDSMARISCRSAHLFNGPTIPTFMKESDSRYAVAQYTMAQIRPHIAFGRIAILASFPDTGLLTVYWQNREGARCLSY